MKQFKVALQLYGIRDEMEKDMNQALAAVKEMGYDYVEFAGFFGKSAEEVREMLDNNGLKCISVHQNAAVLSEGREAILEIIKFFKTIGVEYFVIPAYSLDKLKGGAEWDETVRIFSEAAKLLEENGMQLLYHNHEGEFNKFDGKFILDRLFESIPDLKPQIDTCWVNYAGCDPCEYITKYSGRVPIVHLKDFVCTKLPDGPVFKVIGEQDGRVATHADNGFTYRPVGMGVQDIEALLDAADKAGADMIVVEQDESDNHSTLEASSISRAYLKSLGV